MKKHTNPYKTVRIPVSTLDKWLHYDNDYSHVDVAKALKILPAKYPFYVKEPWNYFTIRDMEKIAFILDKDIVEVFWACYKKPIGHVVNDAKQLKITQALDRAGIR